jgi:RNA polymerase sigma-70 factor (ECF subfamily)
MPTRVVTRSDMTRPATEGEDEAMVRAARDGDRAALAALHARYAPLVHGILMSRLPPSEADDLTQEVFVRVMQRFETLRDPRAFPGWVCALARRFAAGFFRGRRSDSVADGVDAADPSPTAHTRAEAEEVLATIRGLPEAYSETLMLRLVEGLTGPQIAARTGMTHGSVRVNLHRGMALLRERLGEHP